MLFIRLNALKLDGLMNIKTAVQSEKHLFQNSGLRNLQAMQKQVTYFTCTQRLSVFQL